MLERLKARDPEAQAAFRHAAFPKVLATCRQVLGDPFRAEQAAEDIWMDFLFDQVDRVERGDALEAYLRMMTVRRCIRLRDRARRHQELDEGTAAEPGECVALERELLDAVDARRELARLDDCVGKLTAKQRGLVRMRFHLELTLEEIGAHLGVSKQYAGRVVRSTLAQLKKCMEGS